MLCMAECSLWFWSCCRRSTSSLSCQGASCIPPPPGKAPSHTTTSQLLWMHPHTKVYFWWFQPPSPADRNTWLSVTAPQYDSYYSICEQQLLHMCPPQSCESWFVQASSHDAVGWCHRKWPDTAEWQSRWPRGTGRAARTWQDTSEQPNKEYINISKEWHKSIHNAAHVDPIQ